MELNRRQFLSTAALTGGGTWLNASALTPFKAKRKADFSLIILATNWGFQGTYDEFCAKAKADGYDGVEVWLPNEPAQQKALFDALEKHELKVGLLAGSGGNKFDEHLKKFKQAVDATTARKPLFVNCHSGHDYFSFEQNRQFIDYTINASQKTGVPIYHETHRARILFAAHVCRQFIEAMPNLRLTLDISHWTNVHSSLLQDQAESVDLALSRTGHVHSRVGHEQSPQISDPRAPEWQKTVNTHFAWWDKVVAQKMEAGETLTMTTEFGPPSYMPTLPYTNQPVTDLWSVNSYMKDLWRARYGS